MKKNVSQLFLVVILVLGSLVSCTKDDADNSSSDSTATVTIGNQIWMKRNLDVDKYRNGDIIPQVQDRAVWAKLTTGAWCYYGNESAKGAIYGKLYNWYAMNDSRGLAPVGYHIPTEVEFNTMITYLGGWSVAGGKMKEAGISHWIAPNFEATNTSGFTGLPGGNCDLNGDFGKVGEWGDFWCTNPLNKPRYCDLDTLFGSVEFFDEMGQTGFSVRCIKD